MGAVRMLSGNCGCPEVPDGEQFVAEMTRYILAGLMFQERVPGPPSGPAAPPLGVAVSPTPGRARNFEDR